MTRQAGVLGHPIAHSLSPTLHRAAYAALDLAWQYEAYDVTPEDLPAFLRSCGDEWVGLSLTMPLKTSVIPLLDEVSELATSVNAVNTVLFRDGSPYGDNTDVPGARRALESTGVTQVSSATILGGGATARSALASVAALGASDVAVYVRTPSAGESMRPLADELGVSLIVEPWDRAAEGLLSDVVVSTVPAGIADVLADAVPWSAGTLLDVVYANWPTPLASAWTDRGGAVASGLDMLIEQAALQVTLMTGRDAPIHQMRLAVADHR